MFENNTSWHSSIEHTDSPGLLLNCYNQVSMSINTLLIQFSLLRNTSFWVWLNQCNKDLYTVIGICESKMYGFVLHLEP